MLAIRLQRVGRSGHAQFRVVVQDSRRTPTSGKIVALLGNFNPHTKVASLNQEKARFYLEHGAQPSDRVARLLKAEGVKLPGWVKLATKQKRPIKNLEKLRRNRIAEPESSKAVALATDKPADEGAADAEATKTDQPEENSPSQKVDIAEANDDAAVKA
jgi:small subunit ribosomal protein S16